MTDNIGECNEWIFKLGVVLVGLIVLNVSKLEVVGATVDATGNKKFVVLLLSVAILLLTIRNTVAILRNRDLMGTRLIMDEGKAAEIPKDADLEELAQRAFRIRLYDRIDHFISRIMPLMFGYYVSIVSTIIVLMD